jgi:hypothetical protein
VWLGYGAAVGARTAGCGIWISINLLTAELMRKGVTYADLVDVLAQIGVDDKEVNVRNKLSRGKFTTALLLQCLAATGTVTLHLDG